ncbi:TadE family type IV pilus minor pilin [Kitasatospora kifunensis]|uniref:Flp pilus assembly protein TadG n=1 Tax=Kitasatospora kifunensis TaxID=58351 RepID=A0A7W7R3L3_KITKI|nr:TadE family type IV pilus minor pilin [Kitasatospora kifunensis]MBB4924832.1 Flp pilus assembly protein TadG [Kitasatospora kifunensis]
MPSDRHGPPEPSDGYGPPDGSRRPVDQGGRARRRLAPVEGTDGAGQDAGYVTAETAVVVPSLVLLIAMLIWGVLAGVAQLRCIDAARVAARTAARGDPDAVAKASAVAPPGATIQVAGGSDTVSVLVEAKCLGTGQLASALSVTVSATAVAAREDRIGRELG